MRSRTAFANTCRQKFAYAVTRWKNVLLGMAFFWFCRRYPARAKALMVGGVKKALGNDYPIERDFVPSYNPWDQRVCLVPDGDLFEAIKIRTRVRRDRSDRDVHADRHTRLQSGATLEADLIVTATGLNLSVLSDLQITVDGQRVDLADTMAYKGMMFSDVPNLALSMGYTNASWTLKCDLTCEYVCRLLNHMAKHGYTQACPRVNDADCSTNSRCSIFRPGTCSARSRSFRSRVRKRRGGSTRTTCSTSSTLGYGAIDDGVMEFSSPTPGAGASRRDSEPRPAACAVRDSIRSFRRVAAEVGDVHRGVAADLRTCDREDLGAVDRAHHLAAAGRDTGAQQQAIEVRRLRRAADRTRSR